MYRIESSMCIVTRPLLELGRVLHLSFHSHLIGYQNVFPNGALLWPISHKEEFSLI